MSAGRHITWENFHENFIKPRNPATHPVNGQPKCELFVDNKAERIGLRVAINSPDELTDPRYRNIDTRLGKMNGQLCMEISCSTRTLFESFYSMIGHIVDSVHLLRQSPAQALQERAEQFSSLVSTHGILSEEKEVGLWCELWVLNQLISFRGAEAVIAWIGPLRESHDFRLDGIELEVKGTRSRTRSHLISSEDQLQPSVDCELYLVSFQLTPAAGEGSLSLGDQVALINDRLSCNPVMLSLFEERLSRSEFNPLHTSFYQNYRLRTRPALVPITEDTPRITTDFLRATLGTDKSARLSEIKFRLDVTGMGFDEETEQFQSKLQTR